MLTYYTQAKRLSALEEAMTVANAEYIEAVKRASGCSTAELLSCYVFILVTEDLHRQVSDTLRTMLSEDTIPLMEEPPG